MIARSAIMPHICFTSRSVWFAKRGHHDRVSDSACPGRADRDRGVGGILVSADDPLARNDDLKLRSVMAKTLTEIRSLARSHTRTALNVLVGVMRSKDATAAARESAANAILDRGWGKATQAIETGDNGALELIHRIERVIVRPENSDS
jgi:hypothetical protein